MKKMVLFLLLTCVLFSCVYGASAETWQMPNTIITYEVFIDRINYFYSELKKLAPSINYLDNFKPEYFAFSPRVDDVGDFNFSYTSLDKTWRVKFTVNYETTIITVVIFECGREHEGSDELHPLLSTIEANFLYGVSDIDDMGEFSDSLQLREWSAFDNGYYFMRDNYSKNFKEFFLFSPNHSDIDPSLIPEHISMAEILELNQ